jgi:hypothetical protein
VSRKGPEDTAKLYDQLHGLLELAAKEQRLATQPQIGVLEALTAQTKKRRPAASRPSAREFS